MCIEFYYLLTMQEQKTSLLTLSHNFSRMWQKYWKMRIDRKIHNYIQYARVVNHLMNKQHQVSNQLSLVTLVT